MDPVILIISIVVLLALVLFLPVRGAGSFRYQAPSTRFHEADAVLSRRLLYPGTEAYDTYYEEHPHRIDPDNRSRQSPGLLSEQSKYYHPETFAAARANFEVIDFLGLLVQGPPADMTGHVSGRTLDQEAEKIDHLEIGAGRRKSFRMVIFRLFRQEAGGLPGPVIRIYSVRMLFIIGIIGFCPGIQQPPGQYGISLMESC